ncbi:galactose-3-O-sulfotransferase 2-like [Mya arenaria]|uniref:galactose-3-O-sulfotransferase 2-like n=1 Tax=Mya arenaria TaxID=6604 RepID=UPI0022E95BD9|nr:galactose-3-O-sulfotransferase 2-like [Mya arenaria]
MVVKSPEMRIPWKPIKMYCFRILFCVFGVALLVIHLLSSIRYSSYRAVVDPSFNVIEAIGELNKNIAAKPDHDKTIVANMKDDEAFPNESFQNRNDDMIDDNKVQEFTRNNKGNADTYATTTTAEKIEASKEEVQHIAFLKVHKAASSTAQNIFLRFGWKRNLTFVLSPAKNPAGYPNIISLRESLTNSNILRPPPGKHYDILCNHVFYNYNAFRQFMPKDTKFIGIVREPFELYKSILNYFKPRYIFKMIQGPHPASQFLRDPAKYEPKGKSSNSWTRSRMAIEYGFPEELFKKYDKAASEKYLEKIGHEFTMVIIAEYFEDSVVMMRRLLRWQTKDILFVNLNVARHKDESELTKAYDRDFYRNYAKLDYDIYNFFYRRLREQIREEGQDFDDELLAFKELRKRVQEFCALPAAEKAQPLEIPKTSWGEQFAIGIEECKDMTSGEISFITRIRVRQYGSRDI